MDGGREAMFREWMRLHLDLLHRVARGFAPPADQPDLLQELMLAVWRAMPAFRGDSQPITFIYRVAHNCALTWRGREGGRVRRDAEAAAEAVRRTALAADPDEVRMLDRLYAAIRQLPALDRSILLLALDGVPYRDIAQMHEMGEGAVGVRLTRARVRLSGIISQIEAAEEEI
ncbi:RNA polymerase sigma factor [Niveispirillum sp. KHB5.9]